VSAVAEVAVRSRRRVESFASVVRARVVGHASRVDRSPERGEPVREASRGPAGDRARHHRVVCGVTRQRRAEPGICGRLGARDERGAELGRHRAEAKRGGDPGAVHDSARRDDGSVDGTNEDAREGAGAEAVVGRVGIEDAAVTARLDALGDDDVDAGGLERTGFAQAGRGRDQNASRIVQRLDGRDRRDSEVEADDFRLLADEEGEHLVVDEEAPVDLLQRGRRRRAHASELRSQEVDPRVVAGRVDARGRVTEHVHVQGTRRLGLERRDRLPRVRSGRGTYGNRAERPRIRYGGGELRCRHAGHGRLEDRHVDAEQVEERGRRHGRGHGGRHSDGDSLRAAGT